MKTPKKLRALLVPDSLFWITGTMANEIVEFSPWIDGEVISAPVVDHFFANDITSIINQFDIVHILCQYASRSWLPKLQPHLPVVTSHYHVADWEADKHNMDGDAVMAIAREWVTDLEQRGVDMSKVLIHSTGVDTQLFVPPTVEERRSIRSQLGIPDDNIAIGFFAKRSSNNRDDRKGTAVFIQAIQRLITELPNVSVVIVGPGWHDIVETLRSQKIHCVWLKFLKTRAEVAKTYRGLDFYWVTSRIEGGPVPLLESMSTEVCCITTPVGLVPEIGRHGENMMIVPIGDVEGFVGETIRLAANTDARHRIAAAGRRTVVAQKDVRTTTRDIAELYDLAFKTFAIRKGVDRDTLPNCDNLAASSTYCESDNSRRLIPSGARANCLEKSFWGRSLYEQKQYLSGLNWILSGIASDPMCGKAWRLGIQSILPAKITSMLVNMKNAVTRSRGN